MGNDQWEKERAGYLQQIELLNRHLADLQHLAAMSNAHIMKLLYLLGFRADPAPEPAPDGDGE